MYQRSRPQTSPFYKVQIMNVEMIRHIKFSKTRAVAPPRQNLAWPKRARRLFAQTHTTIKNLLESSGKKKNIAPRAGCSCLDSISF